MISSFSCDGSLKTYYHYKLLVIVTLHCFPAENQEATSKSYLFYYPEVEEVGDMSHHGCAAEKDIVADGGEEFHALLQTILRREDNNTIRLLQEHNEQTLVIFKTWSPRT